MEVREIISRISQLSGFSTLFVFDEIKETLLEKIDGTGEGSYKGNSDIESYILPLIKNFQNTTISELYLETKEPFSFYLRKQGILIFAMVVGSQDSFGYCKFIFDQVLNFKEVENNDNSEEVVEEEEEIPNIFKTINKNEIFKFLKK